MALPLTMASPAESASDADAAADSWKRFLESRDALTAKMLLSTCYGCDQCGLRCMEGFKVSRAEWEAVQSYLETQPADEVNRIAAQEKTVAWPGSEESGVDGVTVTFCRYRDMEKNRCSVYPARPTICRLFGHTAWLPCPIDAVPEVPEGAPKLWQDYLQFERRTWSDWDAGANPKEIP